MSREARAASRGAAAAGPEDEAMGRVRERDELQRLIENIPGRTLAAKLRRLLPDIDERIKEGVRHQEIVDALNRHGGFGAEVKLATLRSYLFRYRKAERESGGRRARLRAPPAALLEVQAVSSPPPLERPPEPRPRLVAELARAPGGAVTPSALREVRDEEVDLEALAELGKSTHRKKRS